MGRSILGSVLAIFLLVSAAAACQGTAPTSSPSPTPTAIPTATPSPTPTATPTVSPSATIDPNTSPTPLPTGAPGAFFAVRKYEDALVAGDYAKAWGLLGKGTQAKWGNVAAYQTNRAAFLATSGVDYREELSPPNTLTLSQWIEGLAWASSIDRAHAYLISVKWTHFTSETAGWEIWVASPVKTGWLLYQAR